MRWLCNFVRDYWRLMRGQHYVGDYRADYTPVSPEELHAPDPELDRLYKRSRPRLSFTVDDDLAKQLAGEPTEAERAISDRLAKLKS